MNDSRPPSDSNQPPSFMMAADELRTAGGSPNSPAKTPTKESPHARAERMRLERQYAALKPDDWETFADLFPKTFRALTHARGLDKVTWPVPGGGRPYIDELSRVLKPCIQAEDDTPDEVLFHFMNRELAANFDPTWTVEEFDQTYRRLLEELDDREAEGRPANLGGRKPTDQTFRVEMIREAIGCLARRAYQIDAGGTAKLNDRIALARMFKNDPARCRPRDWEPKFRSRGWGRFSQKSFRNYVEGGVDLFEGTRIGPVLAMLAAEYDEGRLPDNFKDVRAFVAALERHTLPVDARTAIAIFDAFERWKRH